METARIYLVGPRACGKTTVGRALALRLGWRFVDTDELVVRAAGCAIAEIVEADGWDAFRDRETAALASVSSETGVVVATGGGMVLRPENRERMRGSGLVVLLQAPVEVLVERLCADPLPGQRPSLSGGDMAGEVRDVLAQRAPLYESVAHLRADATRSVEEIVSDIMQPLEAKGNP